MLKIISKINCPRCEEVKNYLTIRKIDFEVEMAEDKGYGYWREFVEKSTGRLGFPILMHPVSENEYAVINGSFEEIVNQIDDRYPQETIASMAGVKPTEMPKYEWGQ